MYRIPIEFYNRLIQGESPIPYIVIETHLGYRAYAQKEMVGIFNPDDPVIFDGSWTLGGTVILGAGTAGVIDKSGRLLDAGSFERTLSPRGSDLLVSYEQKQMQHASIQLDNADNYFAKLIPKEPFIGRTLRIYVGFEEESQSTHLRLFTGIISELSVLPVMTIEADEQ
jgi:hypothetical protein